MELTVATSREELVRKYRELCEKHDRLLKRMEEQALERIVVARLSRALLRSRSSAVALIQGRTVVAANPAWRSLDTPSELRDWKDGSTPARTFATLADAVLEGVDPKSAPNGNVLVRVTDGVRVRLQVEQLEANGNVPAATLAIAIQENETGPRIHRVRNHLAAARFQTQLLLGAPDAGPEAVRRAESIADLIRLAGEALDPDPHPPRG